MADNAAAEAKVEEVPSSPGVQNVTVPWELSSQLIPAAAKGDKAACLLLCKMAVPAWADVEFADFTMESLGGGFSGNVPIKCAAKGKQTLAVKINPEGDNEDTLVQAAFKEINKIGIVPAVYCLGDPRAPGLEVYEFLFGTNAGWHLGKHGGEWLVNEDDAKAYGTMMGKLHGAPTEWYEKYKDSVKGQWEAWFTEPLALAEEFKAKYGDYAHMTALWGNKFKGLGKNAEALFNGSNELIPSVYELLPQDTLMGRFIIGHGDAHGCNTMHREVDGHGDLALVDFDFCGKFPAAIDVLGTVLACDGSTAFGYFFGEGPVSEYPSLASRRLVAQAYLDQLGEAVVGKYKRTAVDEIVFDMEIGAAMRWLWMVHIMTPFSFNLAPKCTGWAMLYFAKATCDIVTKAKTDDALKQQVLEKGCGPIIRDAILAKDMTPLRMDGKQYESVWNEFGSSPPAYCGGPFPDDPAAAPAAEETKATDADNNFRAATLKYYKSTGADLDSVFAEFDVDKSGFIDLMELMACAMKCGVGFKTTAEAEAKLKELDTDGDGKVTLGEFKKYVDEQA